MTPVTAREAIKAFSPDVRERLRQSCRHHLIALISRNKAADVPLTMSETTTVQRPERRSVQQTAKDVTNPATIKGVVALTVGIAIVALPGVTLTVAGVAIGIGLVAVGVYDVWFGLTGRADAPLAPDSRGQGLHNKASRPA